MVEMQYEIMDNSFLQGDDVGQFSRRYACYDEDKDITIIVYSRNETFPQGEGHPVNGVSDVILDNAIPGDKVRIFDSHGSYEYTLKT